MKSIVIQAWVIHKFKNQYYLPYTHWVYLAEIIKYYDQITLISPIYRSDVSIDNLISLEDINNIRIIELPYSDGYISAIRHFPKYLKAYSKAGAFTTSYARYPTPFGWLQKYYLKKSNRIIHFVGDPVDAANANPNFSAFKKKFLTLFFKPEHLFYMWACKGAKVYTNGYHLAERLKKYSIQANPVISSTLTDKDFYFDSLKSISMEEPKLLYVGYLRKAKGIETVIEAFRLVVDKYPKAKLSIVGSGEFEMQLKDYVDKLEIKNISFLGHIDNRRELNELFRSHDIFCFASLSEGSPRVILEAMANGINIVSTPVGSLPYVFKDEQEILFADFNNYIEFFQAISRIIDSSELAHSLRLNANQKVQQFTIQNFLGGIFNHA